MISVPTYSRVLDFKFGGSLLKKVETTKFNITTNSDADYALENLPSNSQRTNAVFAAIVTYETTNGTIYTYLTGRFPVTSGRGKNTCLYYMIMILMLSSSSL